MPDSATRILVALEDPGVEEPQLRLASAVAAARNGRLHLVHVLTDDGTGSDEAEASLASAVARADAAGVQVTAHLVRGSSVTAAIREASRQHNCSMMILGWHRDLDPDAVRTARNLGLAKALDVDTVILKERSQRQVRRILVPTGGGGHSIMGLQLAHQLARAWDAEMRVVRIARRDGSVAAGEAMHQYCECLYHDTQLKLQLLGIEAPIEIVPAADVIAPILARAADSDLVILGASNDWLQEEHLAGSIPDEIASRSPCSVALVRSRSAATSRLSDIFWEHTIRLDAHPADKRRAIEMLVDVLVEEKQVPAAERDNILAAAKRRETQGSTAMGRETAIPHAPIPDLPAVIGALAVCPEGIAFDDEGSQPVRFVFLLLTPQQNYRSYIPVLAQIATLMHDESARRGLLDCCNPAEVTALLRSREGPRHP